MKTDWRWDAACQGMDTELWFPVSPWPKGPELQRVQQAQAVCAACPVRMQCLRYATRRGERGVWGGLTEEQRRRSRLCKRIRAESLAS
jgi:WhiB family transcriptional regulator, redox-sensing transcriptional regulator